MTRRDWGPRDPAGAATVAACICLASSAVAAGFTAVSPAVDDSMAPTVYLLAALLSVTGALHLVLPRRWMAGLWLANPVLSLAAITVIDLGVRDASATGQGLLLLPVLYAATQLRARAAWSVATVAVGCVAVVAWSLLPPAQALSDTLFVGFLVLAMTWMLVRSGDRQQQLVERLERHAATDPLTGLATRRILDLAATSAIDDTGEAGTALLVVDVDHFKSINDRHGHPVGDAALVHVARLLQSRCRPGSVVSRLGGDELAVLLPGCTAPSATRRAQELLSAVNDSPLPLPGGDEIRLSISLGVAHCPSDARSLAGLYAAADAALYGAKRAGRGRVGSAETPVRTVGAPNAGAPNSGARKAGAPNG